MRDKTNRIFRHACKKAEINEGASFHPLRHSFAPHLFGEGTEIHSRTFGDNHNKRTELHTCVNIKKETGQNNSPLEAPPLQVNRRWRMTLSGRLMDFVKDKMSAPNSDISKLFEGEDTR
jgi:hypothetical protein